MPSPASPAKGQNAGPPTSIFEAGSLVTVLLPLPLGPGYDYRVPAGQAVSEGSLVEVPLGPRRMRGVVVGAGQGEIVASKVRDILDVPSLPPLSSGLVKFVQWVARYTLADPGAVLRMVLSVPDALDPPRNITCFVPSPDLPESLRLTDARKRILAVAADELPRTAAELAMEAGTGPGTVKGLAEAGGLAVIDMPAYPPPLPLDPDMAGPELSDAQSKSADALAEAVRTGYSVQVLEGVPGSGKTEVYLEAVAEAVRQGGQALILLPEIALSSQWLERFRGRWGMDPGVWHSELTYAQRRAVWRHVAEGKTQVVVGARSALFLPFPDLKVIVVDEEHDPSFKQEDGVIYNARDMAVVRARSEDFPCVLVSATPSLETRNNVEAGRYAHHLLPARHGGAALPAIETVDLTKLPPSRGHWLSPVLRKAVDETLERGEQALLFLNRRGYAPLTLCRTCGHRIQCSQCTAWMVEHRLHGRLQCHHCGYTQPIPDMCPECKSVDSLVACGPGVERLAEEVEAVFPEARVALAASDTLAHPRAAREFVRQIEDHEVDLIIGTQIVAKGYHFPLLTLVGVVDGDLGLSGGDLRAAERTFQLLYQVAGRAGRAERPGRVLIQTYHPAHPVMQAMTGGNSDAFYTAETEARQATHMPPYGRLVGIIVSGPDEAAVDRGAEALARAAPREEGVDVLGPAPAPLAMIRGRHRRRLLMRTHKDIAPQPLLRRWIARAAIPKKVRVQVDVDPYSFM